MKNYWKTTGKRDGKLIVLYVMTTAEKIAEDLACGEGHSLTLIGRQENYRQNPTADSDHLDFATGAFVAAARSGIELHGSQISPVATIPHGLRDHYLGGKDRPYLTAVYEQPID